ncbi:N-formylglutamate amidohydrolase [Roseinatronobacter alkalisoli]|uniref:N-formylglutamate amidohydrolase n=1 Tax=Roseinatronobacter alkalisoli TaxID=3028235 RepID=A0ABT5T9D8_9RHOB|nr:N-formylglutamate amidohydrolase [Roseinatronobacter sp. HJB301]MDD7971601.1 N-formylglutamate amidohydrolase [Roseinatronobacter sp. HJB301]
MNAFDFFPARIATSAVVFASPHSGRTYAPEFLKASILEELALRSSEDAYVDMFLKNAPDYGAPVLLGGVPRAYVDYNRAATELDPALIADVPKATLNPRIMSGLGVIPRVVAGSRSIYAGKITRAAAEDRLQRFWHPYHDRLESVMDQQRRQFGRAILFDMHSMPRDATSHDRRFTSKRPDIVLGDRFGAACAPDISHMVAQIFTAAGLRVARNAPFAGAYIAQRYGTPSTGRHVVQIEIDRGLYLNERTVTPSRNFDSFVQLMDEIVRALSDIGRDRGGEIALAAE